MTPLWPLVAQGAGSLAGDGGWYGAGLLGAVLAWLLLYELPRRDKHIQTILTEYRAETKELREFCQATLNATAARCETEAAELRGEMEKARQTHREENDAQRRAYVEILDKITAKYEANIDALARRIDGGRGRRPPPAAEGGP